MPSCTFETSSVEQTHAFAAELATVLAPGMVISLIGNLGAGKTHLVQGIATALGVDPETVNSPTYVLVQEYDARLPICHIDAYRLADIDEFLELGADELLGADNLCLIEWADRVEDVLPKDRLTITIDTLSETGRRITLASSGPASEAVLSALQTIDHSSIPLLNNIRVEK